MPWLFLLLSLVGAGLTYNTYRPQYAPSRRAVLSFFVGWLTVELALHHIALQALVTAVLIWAGALSSWPGWLGLAVTVTSWVALANAYWRGRESEAVMEEALREGLGADYPHKVRPEIAARTARAIDWKSIALPFPIRHPEVERIRDIPFSRVAGLNLKLDVYRNRLRPTGCPTLLQIHGGGWVLGSKNEQGLPLMNHMAARGWVCVSADYRLSPHATFPDHLIDLKRAIQWIRDYGADYGADPDFLVVTGGSAGGHLAALTALTGNDPRFQPGFEYVDTSVQGCVAFYGVYDFTDRNRLWHHEGLRGLLETKVMKASIEEDPERYELASPIAQLSPDDPPFFVIHGTLDTMVPVAEARHFCEEFRRIVRAPLVYAEIPGAQHAFELFPSMRSVHVVHGVERFLAVLYSRYLDERPAAASAQPRREDRAAG
jgi:acetyl esterase/lipase